DQGTVLEHGDAVTEIKNLLQPVRNIKNRNTTSLQPVDDAIKQINLIIGQSRRRLIHRNDLGIVRESLSDLDDLLLGNREGAHSSIRVNESNTKFGEKFGCRRRHPTVINETGLARLPAEEDVLGDTALRKQVELL